MSSPIFVIYVQRETCVIQGMQVMRNKGKQNVNQDKQDEVQNVEANKKWTKGQKDSSAHQSTGYSSKGPEFKSQHPQGGSQPSGPLVPGGPMSLSDFCEYQATHGAQTYMQIKHTHMNNFLESIDE